MSYRAVDAAVERASKSLSSNGGLPPSEEERYEVLIDVVIDAWDILISHIEFSQREELRKLTHDQLMVLRDANPDRTRMSTYENARIDSILIERLKKRRRICKSIKEAEDEGLFEACEHFTSYAV